MDDIFKAYDIRGKYPAELNEDIAYLIGKAYVDFLRPETVVVGRDIRTSSDSIFEALARGMTEMGTDVIDLGVASTDLMYFSVEKGAYGGGIMITASHNPKGYNGMKLVREHAIPLNADTGLNQIRDLAKKGEFTSAGEPGQIKKISYLEDFIKNTHSFVDIGSIRRFKVVMDAGNGVGGLIIPHVFQGVKIDIIPLFFEPNGNFPNHLANPLLPENRVDLVNKVKETGADLGIAWDGDCDRCFFIDEKGDFIPGDFLTALISKNILSKNPDNTILYDLRSSHAVADTINSLGGRARKVRVGHAFIKQYMREEDAIFAGEVSGHYYYRMGNLFAENGMLPSLQILELMSKEGKELSELTAFPGYFLSGEINSEVEDVQSKLEQLEEKYSDARIDKLDGITIEYDDWWFNVRPSNTEPLLRLCLEAHDKELMEEKRDEVLGIIRSHN
jgi:phosphomannomutase